MIAFIAGILVLVTSVFVTDTSAKKKIQAANEARISYARSLTPADTVARIAPGPEYRRGFPYRILFGSHYRKVWSTPVTAPVFTLKHKGYQYKIYKRAGSQQSMKLKMERSDGLHFAIRSINKDQSKALPGFVSETFIGRLFRDQASALHPYGTIVSAHLAEAANLMHNNPRLYFVPVDSSFGVYMDYLGGQLVSLEEDPDEAWVGHPMFNSPDIILETEELLDRYYTGGPVRFDHLEYAKCRLLDIVLGDWDRHSGQWEWAGYNAGDSVLFKPIIVDRDAAFYRHNDGLFNKLSLLINPKFQTFDEDVNNLRALVFNGLYLDRMLLPGVTADRWLQLAGELQAALTDEVIEAAVRAMPPEAYDLTGSHLVEGMKNRRDHLKQTALEYHNLIHTAITLTGTDAGETLIIRGMQDSLRMTLIRQSSGEIIYDLFINSKLTESLDLYMLGGADSVRIEGELPMHPRIRIRGGTGADVFAESADYHGIQKPVIFYDTPEGNVVSTGKSSRFREETDLEELDYNRTGDRREIK